MRTRVLYLVSHPIQYQAPLLRLISKSPSIELTVGFTGDNAVERYDAGFASQVAYDVPLLEGYESTVVSYVEVVRQILETDVVWLHGWQGRKQLFSLAVAKIARRPVLMRCETWEGAYGLTPAYRKKLRALSHSSILRLCDAYLSIGSKNTSYLLSLGCAKSQIFLVPYAVDNDYFGAGSSRALSRAWKDQLGIPSDRPVILFAGKLTERKRPLLLLEAWRMAEWTGEQPVLVFAGDGELRPLLERAIRPGESVICTGFVNQSGLPALYGAADLFVLPSRHEPWGLAVNEALASGTPVVISSEVGAAPDLVTESTGGVFEADDPSELARILSSTLTDPTVTRDACTKQMTTWSFAQDLAGLEAAIEASSRNGHRYT